MTNLDKKLNDFRARFSLAGWMNGDINVTVLEKWFKENFKEEIEEVKELKEEIKDLKEAVKEEFKEVEVPETQEVNVVDDMSMKEDIEGSKVE